MRRIRLLTLAFAGILTLGLMAYASLASAADPEGILPDPSTEKPVTFKIKQENTGTLQTLNLNNPPIKCEALTGEGKATTLKLGTIKLLFEKCTASGTPCTGLSGEASGTIATEGEFHTWWVLLSNELKPGIVILPKHTHFACVAGTVLVLVLGCIAGWLLGANELLKTLLVHFEMTLNAEKNPTGDTDIPEVLKEGATKEEACVLLTSINEGAEESSGILQLVELFEFKQGTVAVTALMMY